MLKVDVQKTFGISVRALRGRLGLSQEELAERAGLHRTYVCDIERGARNVSLKSIEKLANALEVPLAILFASKNGATERAGFPAGSERAPDGMVDILLVEDNPEDAELALEALKQGRISNRIHWVRDGAEALDFLFRTGSYRSRSSLNDPQVMLLDLNLPKVNGLEVLRRIRGDERTRSIHVVVLTGSKFDRDIATSMRLGANAYIVKPVDFQNFSKITPALSLQWALLKPASAVA